MLFASLFIWVSLAAQVPALTAPSYQDYNLEGIHSPTALVSVQGQWLLAADLNDLAPGLFRLEAKPEQDRWTANRIKSMPQLAIEALAFDAQHSRLRLVSGRKFSVFEEDWASTIKLLTWPTLNPFDSWDLDITNTCYSGLQQCGLSAAIQLDDSRWLLFKKQQPSQAFLYQRREGSWQRLKSAPLGIQRRHVIISDAQLIGDQVVVLLKDRWVLARIPLATLEGKWPPSLPLEPFFSFKSLSKRFAINQRRMRLEGIAEAFAIDERGRLMLVLNNRGFAYFSRHEETRGDHPKLIVFDEPIAEVDQP